MKKKAQILKLKGKTAVFIDWANAYNWKNSLKWEINLQKLFKYLKSYRKVKEVGFYFGTDEHPASKEQIKDARKIGYRVITKPVKYLPIKDKETLLWKRKCDFDLESGHLGKEVRQIKKGIYLCVVKKFKNSIQKISPRRRQGA